MVDNETLQDTQVESAPQESTEVHDNEQDNTVSPETQNLSSKDENMRALREKTERLQRQNEEYSRTLQEIAYRDQLLAQQQQQYQQQPQQQTEIDPGDDDLVEGKHYKKLARDLKEVQRQAYEAAVESRIRGQFPDYDKVVNLDTIKALKIAEPEWASSLAANPNFLEKAVGTYKAIQRLNLTADTTYDADKALAQKNANKPRTLTSISPQQGESPLTRANAFAGGLTPELQKQLYKEMQDARKRS
jgi:hypothetical protein